MNPADAAQRHLHDRPSMTAPLSRIDGVDAARGLQAVGGQLHTYRRLLALFIDVHQHDGAELRRLLACADTESAARLVHRLRGSAAMLGLLDVDTAAAALYPELDRAHAGPQAEVLAAAMEQVLAHTARHLHLALAH